MRTSGFQPCAFDSVDARWIVFALLVLLLATSTGSAQSLPRKVIAETFGRPDCDSCLSTRARLDSLETADSSSVFVLHYFRGTELGNSETEARAASYSLPDSSGLVLDGDVTASDLAIETYRSDIDARNEVDPPLKATIEYAFLMPGEGEIEASIWELNVDIQIGLGESVANPEEVVIRPVIYEREVSLCCGSNGQDRWQRVVRMLPPPRTLTASESGEQQLETYFINAVDDWEARELAAAILVQRETDRSILNGSDGLDANSLLPVPPDPPPADRVILRSNVPNPFRRDTEIQWSLVEEAYVRLRIYNARGQVVRVLNDGTRGPGDHRVSWNGRDFEGRPMAAGVYVVELFSSEGIRTQRITLLR